MLPQITLSSVLCRTCRYLGGLTSCVYTRESVQRIKSVCGNLISNLISKTSTFDHPCSKASNLVSAPKSTFLLYAKCFIAAPSPHNEPPRLGQLPTAPTVSYFSTKKSCTTVYRNSIVAFGSILNKQLLFFPVACWEPSPAQQLPRTSEF